MNSIAVSAHVCPGSTTTHDFLASLRSRASDTVVRRCCTYGCGMSGSVSEYEGRRAYFCTSDRCNGAGAESVLAGEYRQTDDVRKYEMFFFTGSSALSSTTMSTTTTTAAARTTVSCFECSGLSNQACTAMTSNCPMCMIYRNPRDPSTTRE